MFEKLTKKIVYKAILGELKVPIFAGSMVDRTVEDAEFMGREDSHLAAEDRALQILDQMSLEEKVRFVGGYKQLGIQPVPRLGLPSIWCSDATSGLRSFPGGTSFFAGVAMAATWDPEMIEKVGCVIGEQFRARGVSVLLGPGVNIYRVPTCGRNFEYMGEDPYLVGKISAAYIRGVQSKGVLTIVKHFAANNSEYDRHKTDSVVDERTLREIYLPAFRMAVQEGGTWGVMSSYNPVNGVYASENRHLLKEILRDEWDFKGFVVSDWNSLYSTVPAIKNGLNLEMPWGKWVNLKTVSSAIERGEISESDIDNMLSPLLCSLFKAGVYDRPQIDPEAKIHTPEHINIAQEAAGAAVVLLKNKDAILPIDPGAVTKIVVMGRTAVNTPTGGGGSSYLHRLDSIDLLTGVRAEFPGIRVEHIPFNGAGLSNEQEASLRTADAVIIGAGFFTYEESECFDRAWELPESQNDLIRQAAKLNPRTIVVLTTGGGVETESWLNGVPAVIHSFFLGEFAGEVIAKVLSGEINPGGKLPFSMAKRWSDFASTSYYVKNQARASLKYVFIGQGNPGKRKVWQMKYGEGLNVGYRHFDTAKIEPQFAFGHGLSYTDFDVSEVKTELKNGLPSISLLIKNVGSCRGSQVVQCYVRDIESTVFRPEKELKAFQKVFLEPGESRHVSLDLPESAFQFFDEARNQWALEKGEFEIILGFSSREIFAKSVIEL